MITEKAYQRIRVLAFWEKHGLKATMDAFPAKRRTLFLWKKKLRDGHGKLETLNGKSKAPLKTRKRMWPLEILLEIKRLREEHPNLGKEKLFPELQEFCLKKKFDRCPLPSTIGRIITDMGGLRMFPQKVSHFGKIKKAQRKKVLRKPKGLQAEFPGHVVALDTIEKFVDGCRRYIITFEDIFSRFAFAWGTTSHASKAAKEFFERCQMVFPYPITFILTDNGSEFQKEFSKKLKQLHLTHYHTVLHNVCPIYGVPAIQLTTLDSSLMSDLDHNIVYKKLLPATEAEKNYVVNLQRKASAQELKEM